MPKLTIPRGTKPRALLALAGLLDGFAMGDLPADLMNAKPGCSISPRTAIRYAARCVGKSRDEVAAMTSGDMRALFVSEALKAAIDRNAWREGGEVEVEVEGEDEAPVAKRCGRSGSGRSGGGRRARRAAGWHHRLSGCRAGRGGAGEAPDGGSGGGRPHRP
jgi:hypothetical protein